MYLRGPSAHGRRNGAIAFAMLAAMVVPAVVWFSFHLGMRVEPPRRSVPGLLTLEEARRFTGFPAYWLGDGVGNAEFFSVRQEQHEALVSTDGRLIVPGVDRISVAYYGCDRRREAGLPRCGALVQVTSSPVCDGGEEGSGSTEEGFPFEVDGQRIRVDAGHVQVIITGFQRLPEVSLADFVGQLELLQDEKYEAGPAPAIECASVSQTTRTVNATDRLSDYYGPPRQETELPLAELLAFERLPLLWFGPVYDGFELNAVSLSARGITPLDDTIVLRYGDCGGARAAAATCAPEATVRIARHRTRSIAKELCSVLRSGAVYKLGHGRLRLWTGELDVVVEDESIVDESDALDVIARLRPLNASAEALEFLPEPWRPPCTGRRPQLP